MGNSESSRLMCSRNRRIKFGNANDRTENSQRSITRIGNALSRQHDAYATVDTPTAKSAEDSPTDVWSAFFGSGKLMRRMPMKTNAPKVKHEFSFNAPDVMSVMLVGISQTGRSIPSR